MIFRINKEFKILDDKNSIKIATEINGNLTKEKFRWKMSIQKSSYHL